MDVLEEGHKYSLANGEILTFLKRDAGKLIHFGTTNEEVIEVLINRMRFLQDRLSCSENVMAIAKLEEALLWLECRTKKRVAQKVEMSDAAHRDSLDPDLLE